MWFGQGYQPIQALASNRADDPFADRIGHRAARRRFQYLDSEPCYRLVEAFGENTVAVVKQIFVLAFASDGLAQLLHRPSGSWMGGDVAMDEAPAAMFDHHKHVSQPERRGHDDQEIAGNDWCTRRNVDQRKLLRGRPGGRGGKYFRTVRGDTRIPSFNKSSFAIRSSPHQGFWFAMRRIRACNCWGIGGRPGRDLSRQNNLHPARCQRIIVSGRTATSESRQSQNFESIDSTIRVAGSIRRRFAATPSIPG